MTRAAVRGVGKTDLLDAVRIARSVLGFPADRLRIPRADGDRAALRVLVVAREQMSTERTRTINALVALVRTIDLEVDARRPLTKAQVRTIAAWRNHQESLAAATARTEATRLARRRLALDAELTANRSSITVLVTTKAPALLELPGVGAVVAAAVLLAWSHPGEAPFGSCDGQPRRHRSDTGVLG